MELGESIIPRLIDTFCDSPYIDSCNYMQTIEALLDIFYNYKNEMFDTMSDDELLTFMKEAFDGECQGSLDYLEETCLEAEARIVRQGYDSSEVLE